MSSNSSFPIRGGGGLEMKTSMGDEDGVDIDGAPRGPFSAIEHAFGDDDGAIGCHCVPGNCCTNCHRPQVFVQKVFA